MMRTFSCAALISAVFGALAWGSFQAGGAPPGRWEAPAEARAKTNPIAQSPEAIAEGKALYETNCHLCHGASGRGDGPATQYIKPAPSDISAVESQTAMTDGEIFWKLTTGRDPMPPFEKKLTERERWLLVHYVRSLNVDNRE